MSFLNPMLTKQMKNTQRIFCLKIDNKYEENKYIKEFIGKEKKVLKEKKRSLSIHKQIDGIFRG